MELLSWSALVTGGLSGEAAACGECDLAMMFAISLDRNVVIIVEEVLCLGPRRAAVRLYVAALG
jgi:hypothetical protein